jgi:hypothetical protein
VEDFILKIKEKKISFSEIISIISNLLVGYLAISPEGGGLDNLIWIYIIQMFTIIFFYTVEAISAKCFKKIRPYIKICFFMLIIYIPFLLLFMSEKVDIHTILKGSAVFFLNQLFLFISNREKNKDKIEKKTYLFLSYVLPIHFVILVGFFLNWSSVTPLLLIFILLKIIIDISYLRRERLDMTVEDMLNSHAEAENKFKKIIKKWHF